MRLVNESFIESEEEKKSSLFTIWLSFVFVVFAFYVFISDHLGAETGRVSCSELEPIMGQVLYSHLDPFRKAGFKRTCYKHTDDLSMKKFEYELYTELLVKYGYL